MPSLKLCTSEYMLSNVNGLGVRRGWLPRVLNEQFLESSRDGEIKLSPDPVTMIDGDLTWHNDSDGETVVFVLLHRAPRTIIAQSPSTVVIHDAWSSRVGKSPSADYPGGVNDSFGGRLQIDRASVASNDIQFARYFLECDDSQVWVPLGRVPNGQGFHFRYRASVQTPGTWVSPGSDSEIEPRWEAYAYWTRLIAFGWPVGSL
ncbi:hypothetical protein I5G59_gp33 [Mycobacterium phage LilMcDreamy]|uniref:DUF7172 domain-containing protein n=1 Tax=Mycobacterium phage LilMcDreamy TaxID=2652422 RepID=A0A5P8D6I6_9CAUD|nr:hypothetical protein I5G59_gp33 [Mycobacterium phage LilMcDreamy]QFP94653.1 hypothetical protein SEA_LILMCDREAMY_33 [Mycobacterium phage LilMcDreamy]